MIVEAGEMLFSHDDVLRDGENVGVHIVHFLGSQSEYILRSEHLYQVVGVASIDGTVIVVTGTYYDEKDKAEIVDIVNLLISNAKIVS